MAECLESQIRGFVPSPAGNGEHSRHLSRKDTCFIRLIFLRSRFFIKPCGVNNSYCTCGRLGEHHPDTPSWKGLLPMWVSAVCSWPSTVSSCRVCLYWERSLAQGHPLGQAAHTLWRREGGLSEGRSDEQYLFQSSLSDGVRLCEARITVSPLPLPSGPTFTFPS